MELEVYRSIVIVIALVIVSCASTEIRYFPIEGAVVAPWNQAVQVCNAEANQAKLNAQGGGPITTAGALRAISASQNAERACMGRYGYEARKVPK